MTTPCPSRLSPRVLRTAACVALSVLAVPLGAAAPSASAHGSGKHAAGLSERRLRAMEIRTLGAAHAAEHAQQRASLRDPRARARAARVARAARRMRLRALVNATPAQDGQWAAPFAIPAIGIHATMLPTGKVLWFYRNGDDVQNGRAELWNPVTNAFKQVPPPTTADGHTANIFCASQSLLPDGRLLVMGGQVGPDPSKVPADEQEFKGLNAVFTFNPYNETWTRQPDMRDGRWYPTQVLTPDGRVIVMSGYDSSGVKSAPQNPDIELFTPSADLDGVGTITRIGHRGGAGEPPAGGLYPHLFTMPSGRTLVAGPRPADSWFLNPVGGGAPTWTDAADPARHGYGTGVILPNDTPGAATQVELIGGGTTATKGTQVFDEAAPNSGWVSAASLNVARSHLNTVILPDASMVTVGGGLGEVDGRKSDTVPEDFFVELYDPTTRTWRLGPAQQEARAYHSTALLLPDGRVVSAGDDTAGGNNKDTAEIYSPPYLFNGPRPEIAAAPDAIGYGQSFAATFAGSDVAKAVLVAPGATTHAVDMNQRYVPVAITARTASSVTLAAPANANLAPPGYYMLFLLNAKGVPSVSKFVKVGSGGVVAQSQPPAPQPQQPGPQPQPQQPGPQPQPQPQQPQAPGTPMSPAPGAKPPLAPSTPIVPAKPGTKPTSPELTLDELLRTPSIARQTLRRVAAGGLRVGVSCARTCTVRGEIRLDRRSAFRLKLARRRTGTPTVLIGRGTLKVRRGQRGKLTVKLTAVARKRVPRAKTLVLRIRLTATDLEGTTETVSRKLTLKR